MEMGRFLYRFSPAVLAGLLILSSAAPNQEKQNKKQKHVRKDVMNFDGGILFETDGSLSDITCFRLSGRAAAPGFFENFKRIDDEHGTQYQRGREVVTEFPEELHFSFVIRDIPCPTQFLEPGPRRYLTKEMMQGLRFSFYWKRGVELRHIESIKQEVARAEAAEVFNTESKEELVKRYRWFLGFTVPSAGVPLTDSLVLILRTPDGHIAARVAARL